MNQYGAIAWQHWQRWRPASYAAITDPAAYFTVLGAHAAGEITRLWAQLRDQDGNPSGEDYLARVARLNALRKQAEEIVLADLILLPPGPGSQVRPVPPQDPPARPQSTITGTGHLSIKGDSMTTGQPAQDDASGSHSPPLNYYGRLVQHQWEDCLPDVCQQIRDPGLFFGVLGEVIAHRIDEVAGHLAGDDQPGEGYLAKVARLTAARQHAQERVLGEYLLLPPDEDRPAVVDRGHPSWAEVDAEQRGRLGEPPADEGRP